MMESQEEFLTAAQASQATGLSPSTIRRLAWERKIRFYKVLGALRFRRADLEELVSEFPAERTAGKRDRGHEHASLKAKEGHHGTVGGRS